MDSGFRGLSPNAVRIRRIPIASSETNITVLSAVPDKRISLIASSLSASGAGTVDFQANTAFRHGHTFAAAGDWILPRNPDGWVECNLTEDLRIANPGELTLRGVVIAIEIG